MRNKSFNYWIYLLCLTPFVTDLLETQRFPTAPIEYLTEIILGGLIIFFISMIHRHANKLTDLAVKDSLTGLYNRHRFMNSLEQAMAIAQRLKTPLSLVYIDVDKFKSINDTYGHTVGDTVLSNVAQLLLTCAKRRSDYCYRLGGDEFAIILVGLDADSATNMIDAGLLKNRSSFPLLAKYNVTFSYGATELTPEDNYQRFLHRADTLMYQSKRARSKQQNRNILQKTAAHYPTEATTS
ncbi:GGDEF domain-containing protein [Kaarinaea lacus]